MAKEAILCVDDEAVILIALKQELKRHFRERYVVETALSSAEAEEVLRDLSSRGVRTVLVLTDWFMPGTRGDQFLVKLHTADPEIKTILITGHAEEESITRAQREAGLCAFIEKPWRSEELFATIEKCLAGETCEG